MLTHNNASYETPARVVLLGGSGFVGSLLTENLSQNDVPVLSLSSADVDLCSDSGVAKLSAALQPTDSLVVLSALTPDKGRGIDTFMKNLKMIEGVCTAIKSVQPAHVVYFSSDAVYPLSVNPVREDSPAAPADLYGAMHVARELMLKDTVENAFCVLRPTLIYGANDSHNSYGPNRFRRQAAADGKIGIGGEGEETRDHVYVHDVAELVRLVLGHRSQGTMNVATGQSVDFGTLARMIASQFDKNVEVCPSPRGMPVTHRSFDTTACRKAFPEFVFTSLEDGLAEARKDVM